MAVWAFNGADHPEKRQKIHESVKAGKSRFGWSWEPEHDLNRPWTDQHPRQQFLRRIRPGDWIVHINTPSHGKCITAQVVSDYGFDGGVQCPDGVWDFRHNFDVDVGTIVEFDRGDPGVEPAVNLCPRGRQHRVKAAEDFFRTLENIKSGETANLYRKAEQHLRPLTRLIHEYHPRKRLETFLAEAFKRLPGVCHVEETGSRWGTDHGTDLIVDINPLAPFGANLTLVVQVKSFEGEHHSTHAVDQIVEGIRHHKAHAGLIVTTGDATERLTDSVADASTEQAPIALLDADDVARLVIRHAPDLVFAETRPGGA